MLVLNRLRGFLVGDRAEVSQHLQTSPVRFRNYRLELRTRDVHVRLEGGHPMVRLVHWLAGLGARIAHDFADFIESRSPLPLQRRPVTDVNLPRGERGRRVS